MTDVVLAPGRLVGDDAVRVRLGTGAGGRRDRDQRLGGREVVPVVAKRQDVATVGRMQGDDLGRVHRRAAPDRDHDRPARPEGDERLAAREDRCRARVGLDVGEETDRQVGVLEHLAHAIDDAGAAARPGR